MWSNRCNPYIYIYIICTNQDLTWSQASCITSDSLERFVRLPWMFKSMIPLGIT